MYNLPQTPSERERESDRLFLEFAIKRCALTLSRAEILALTEQILTPASERQAGAALPAYGRTPDESSPSPSVAEEDPYFSALLSEEEASPPRPLSPALDSPPSPEISDQLPSKKSRRARKKQQKKKKSFFGDFLFYGVLIALIVGVVVLTGRGGQGPRSFAGFTVQTVLTSSMESVFPKGSLVISRYTEPDTLAIGDDITFMASEDTTISHRIIGIVENYADTGQRAFQTQGVMNAAPDSELVPAVNVVGKVVFHSYAAGRVVDFVKSYWPLLIFFLVLLAVLIRVLRYIYCKEDGSKSAGANKPDPKGRKRKRQEKRPFPQNPTIQA